MKLTRDGYFPFQRGLEAEHSLSWTPLSLGFYHDLKANLMIFWYLYLPITQRKPILFRKEDCLLGCIVQAKAKREQESLYRLILYAFSKENICVGYYPKNCQSDCCRSAPYGFMIYFSSSGKTVWTPLKRIGNWYFDRTRQKNTMSRNIVQNKNNILVNGSFILHFLSFLRSNVVSK